MKKLISTILAFGILIVLAFVMLNREIVLKKLLIGNFDKQDYEIGYNVDVNELSNYTHNYFYYNTLNEDQKKMYSLLLRAVRSHNKRITLNVSDEIDYNSITENVSKAMNSVLLDYPEIFYINPDYEIVSNNIMGIDVLTLNINYTITESQVEEQTSQINEKIEQIISQNISEDMSDYDKEIVLHDYIAKNIIYYKYDDISSIPSSKHGIYSALIDKSAVCDGISKAYQILLNSVNVNNILVTGKIDSEPHAWNVVKIEDDWYHVDVTSNMSLMKSGNKELVIHPYFNITTKTLTETHYLDDEDKLPECISSQYDYYSVNDFDISYMDNFSYKLKQIILKQEDDSLLEFKAMGISDVPTKLVETLYLSDFNNYKTKGITQIQYTKVNDVYIVVK